MEFLADTPLNESGKAKEVDRDDLNSFVYSVAYHAVINVINRIYYFTNEIRVMDLGFSEEEKSKMLPNIPVPERYEILSESYLLDQVAAANTAKINPLIVGLGELDYVNKKYENYPEIRERVKTIVQLNPLPLMTPEQKDAAVMAGTVLKEDAMMSNYIVPFVEKAIQENEGFLEMDYDAKYKIIQKYAQEKIGEAQAAQAKQQQEQRKLLTEEVIGRATKAA
jgi:hypothetical protein